MWKLIIFRGTWDEYLRIKQQRKKNYWRQIPRWTKVIPAGYLQPAPNDYHSHACFHLNTRASKEKRYNFNKTLIKSKNHISLLGIVPLTVDGLLVSFHVSFFSKRSISFAAETTFKLIACFGTQRTENYGTWSHYGLLVVQI